MNEWKDYPGRLCVPNPDKQPEPTGKGAMQKIVEFMKAWQKKYFA